MRAAAFQPGDIRARMDRMYRPQVPIYDLTRKHYLLGRDRLIDGIGARPGEIVLEVGCGTGRNLVRIARRYPGIGLLGIDAAAPMLAAAERGASRHGIAGRVRLARGVAEELDPATLFGLVRPVDHVVISYTLSMVDDPAGALHRAVAALRPGGMLHIVDFGDQAGLPGWFRRLLVAWLGQFGVRYRPEIETCLADLAGSGAGSLERHEIGGRYALLFRFRRAG
jgi:S-adenosylmethionine-diacylgycerolhomoserine-N-methlytransferase